VNDTTDTLHILSTAIDTIFGLPNGITYVKNPASNTISPNGRQCIQFTGAALDNVGVYPLQFIGYVHVISAALGDTVISFQDFNGVMQGYGYSSAYQYSLTIVPIYIRPCLGL